jgi:hypothetical protein
MRAVRLCLFVAALASAGAWIYAVAGSAARLFALLDGFDAAPVVARVDEEPADPDGPAQSSGSPPLAAAAESDDGLLPRQIPTDELSPTQIMRLLEDEVASDTDPAAAEELLRAFGESLDSQE